MTQLTTKEIDALEELMHIYQCQVNYCKDILGNKFFPERSSDEIGYIFKDRLDERVNRLFTYLENLHERTQEQ